MRASPPGLFLALVTLVLAASSSASIAQADDKQVCLDAASKGQVLRDDHKLVEARDAFRVCAQKTCPTMVRRDCLGWLDAVETGVPTLVISAKDGSGADLVDVKVTIDGTLVLSSLDRRSMPMNPGTHTFHFELADGTSADERVVVAEGSKDKQVSVVLGHAIPTPPLPSRPPQPTRRLRPSDRQASFGPSVGSLEGSGLGDSPSAESSAFSR
jgi:hypothetical protein